MDRHNTLAAWLTYRSSWVCSLNQCTDEGHNCESYAYLDKDLNILDICSPDFFRGSSEPYAAIPLPYTGSQEELEKQVREQIEEQT